MTRFEDPREPSEAPELPTMNQPLSKQFDSRLSGALDDKLSLIAIPTDLRRLIYNFTIPFGPLIVLQINAYTTLLKHLYALSNTCRFLHDEITLYLQTRPLTVLCTFDLRPNILSGISSSALHRIETLIIEDYADSEPIWPLLPNLKSICFSETYTSTIHPDPGAGPDPGQAPSIVQTTSTLTQPLTRPDPQDPPIQLTWPNPAPLPSTNPVLAHFQRFWQDLRLRHRWIYNVWKRELPPYDALPKVRILLRRVYEARVAMVNNHNINKIVAWHAVVDVDSRKVIENRHLAIRAADEDDGNGQDVLFPYAAQTWWRREPIVKNGA